jgi:hypothetical protein
VSHCHPADVYSWLGNLKGLAMKEAQARITKSSGATFQEISTKLGSNSWKEVCLTKSYRRQEAILSRKSKGKKIGRTWYIHWSWMHGKFS